jgi:DNA-directed RNA polymerase specialized sigma24 family protein
MQTNHPAQDAVERDLLRRAAQGDMQAFNNLYIATRRKVYEYLYRMLVVPAIADIALVETYLQVGKCAGKYKGTVKVSTWLLSIARTVAHYKLSQPHIKNAIEKQMINAQTKISLNSLDRQRLLYQAVHALPLQQREVLNLALLPDSSYEEIKCFPG